MNYRNTVAAAIIAAGTAAAAAAADVYPDLYRVIDFNYSTDMVGSDGAVNRANFYPYNLVCLGAGELQQHIEREGFSDPEFLPGPAIYKDAHINPMPAAPVAIGFMRGEPQTLYEFWVPENMDPNAERLCLRFTILVIEGEGL